MDEPNPTKHEEAEHLAAELGLELRPARVARPLRRAEAIIVLVCLAVVASIILEAKGW